MKKIALLAFLAFWSNAAFSQQWNGNTNTTDPVYRDGKVSVGTSQSIDKFNVSGGLRMVSGAINFGYVPFSYSGMNSYFSMKNITNTLNSSNLTDGFYLYPMSNDFISIDITGATFYPDSYKSFYMNDSGSIGMGTVNLSCTDCGSYRLFVKNGIRTEKVKVDIAAGNNWADYVFAKDYKLMPLKELSTFIETNGHLPEVPTTEEAMRNGIELKEMNILLLKKIEELTLHTIRQQEQLDKQAEKIGNLENAIKSHSKF